MLPLAGGDYGTVLRHPGNDFAIPKMSWPGEDPANQQARVGAPMRSRRTDVRRLDGRFALRPAMTDSLHHILSETPSPLQAAIMGTMRYPYTYQVLRGTPFLEFVRGALFL